MAAVTVNNRLNNYCHIPGQEIVDVSCAATGDTFQSEKFSVVIAAHLTCLENASVDPNVTVSSKTATLNYTGGGARRFTLTLYGRP